MSREQASSFGRLALQAVEKEYPNKPADVLNDEKDARPPKALHPAFYGSFDWHSSVHGHWMLVRLLRLFPDLPEAKQIREVLGKHLTAENLRTEADSFARPNAASFERPYGWAWLLKLAEELHGWDDPDGPALVEEPATADGRDRLPLPRLFSEADVPDPRRRSSEHGLRVRPGARLRRGRWATAKLRDLIEERSRAYFGKDAGVPAAWEPDGTDFLSPSLEEADLMRRVLPPEEFRAWFRDFLPDLAKGEPKSLLEPAKVTDRTDPQLVHLDGLNLSRAWCMRSIAAALPKDDPARKMLAESAARHAESALGHVASGDYVGEHWLASFAVYLFSTPAPE